MVKIPKIAVFGASGGTGRALVARIEGRGWPAHALVRGTVVPFVSSPRIEVRRGDLLAPDEVATVVRGVDAVCCVFGPRRHHADVFCAEATRHVVNAMKRHDVRRLICVTGAMIGDYRENRSLALQWAARAFALRRPAVAADRHLQERVVGESGLDWTLVKPPRLTDGPSTGRAVLGPALRVGLFSSVSRSDLAEVILEEIGRPLFVGRAVFVTV